MSRLRHTISIRQALSRWPKQTHRPGAGNTYYMPFGSLPLDKVFLGVVSKLKRRGVVSRKDAVKIILQGRPHLSRRFVEARLDQMRKAGMVKFFSANEQTERKGTDAKNRVKDFALKMMKQNNRFPNLTKFYRECEIELNGVQRGTIQNALKELFAEGEKAPGKKSSVTPQKLLTQHGLAWYLSAQKRAQNKKRGAAKKS